MNCQTFSQTNEVSDSDDQTYLKYEQPESPSQSGKGWIGNQILKRKLKKKVA